MVTRKKTTKAKAKSASKKVASRDGRPGTVAKAAQASAKAPVKATAKPRARRTDGDGASPPAGSLVVVESPTKAKSIGKYLGRGFDVRATVGHIRDLPTRKLGVDVDNGFQPEYVTIKGKAQTLAELKKAASKATAIYLATDPDREGEAIAWHVADQIDTTAPVHRVLFHEITKDAVRAAMAKPQRIDTRLVEAQQARRILDRLVGYKASPILWHSIKTGLSAGRVQTVALRMIVEREREIRQFKPKEYWSIGADCASHGQEFTVELKKIDGHNPQLTNEAAAQAVVNDLRAMPFVVTKVEKRHRKKRPGAPFTTSTIQQEAAKKLGFSARRTMRAAQDLYEGIEFGDEGPAGLSPTCVPIRSGYRIPRSPRSASTSAPTMPPTTCRRRPTSTPRARRGCRTRTRPSGPPTSSVAPRTWSSSWNPTSSGCTR